MGQGGHTGLGRSLTWESCSWGCVRADLSGQTSWGMLEQWETGAGKISCFLQGRTDPLSWLTSHLILGLFREKAQCLCSVNR